MSLQENEIRGQQTRLFHLVTLSSFSRAKHHHVATLQLWIHTVHSLYKYSHADREKTGTRERRAKFLTKVLTLEDGGPLKWPSQCHLNCRNRQTNSKNTRKFDGPRRATIILKQGISALEMTRATDISAGWCGPTDRHRSEAHNWDLRDKL